MKALRLITDALRPLLFIGLLTCARHAPAQTSSAPVTASNAVPHVTVPFNIADPGTKLPDITWGLDLAWLSEGNVQRGVNFAGKELIDIVRLSFQTTNTEALNGQLTSAQKKTLNERINIVKKHAPEATINLNSDQMEGTLEQVTEWYRSSNSSTQATRWAELIALTKRYVEDKGLKVTSVSPFNEPDYTPWHQGSKADFTAICKKLREDEEYKDEFADIKLCGGNTLNNDQALSWYQASKRYLDEGNTHQLAGSFDNFAKFYQTVAADGKVGVGDELHNTMECMVGSEYGLTKGIWWGTCDHTRSQFMKASRGTRLAYAEHRSNWTATGVYRHPDGHVQGFGGTSERQAVTTLYRFAALDHDVFYNGQGPTREYLMNLPGGTGYQTGQTNAETVIDIQDGADIMPPLPTEATTYKLVNRASGHVLSFNSNALSNGGNLTQERTVKTGNAHTVQQWIVRPVGERSGGDFSYYKIMNARDTTYLIDVLNWSLADRGAIIGYKGGLGDNEQWFLEYAGDGWFYIRSRHSAYCLEVTPGTTTALRQVHRTICQGPVDGNEYQQWRLLPADVTYDTTAPASPTLLTAMPQAASVRLTWLAPEDTDLKHYVVLRSTDGETWNTLHNSVPATEYVDNTAADGVTYKYKVLAVDQSLNRSTDSNAVESAATGQHTAICQLLADSLLDTTGNGNHAALCGTFTTVDGPHGKALSLDGTSNFMQLSATIANTDELTFTAWVNWRGGSKWQRIFDFGIDTDHYVFFTTSADNGPRLAIKNGGPERTLTVTGTTFGTNKWRHVAVTFAQDSITIYLDGKRMAQSTAIKDRPSDIRPVFNYIGRSQFSADPLLKAAIEDVRIYNCALSAPEVAQIADGTDAIGTPSAQTENVNTQLFNTSGHRITPQMMRPGHIYILGGKKVMLK